jgi:putative ABC transport system permease protein
MLKRSGKLERMLQGFSQKTGLCDECSPAAAQRGRSTKRQRKTSFWARIAAHQSSVGGIGNYEHYARIGYRTHKRILGIQTRNRRPTPTNHIQFLIETVVLSTLGGIIGLVMGITNPLIITYFTKMRRGVLHRAIIILLCASACGIGIIFGLYPAINARPKLTPSSHLTRQNDARNSYLVKRIRIWIFL